MNKERFNSKWTPEPFSGCWLWLGWTNCNGYGEIHTGRPYGKIQAHRLSWILHKGEIPAGMQVLHHCDVRPCVNPDHLWLGTNDDNARDKLLKNRQSRFLTPKQVEEIRVSNATSCALASKYGVHPTTIGDIRRGVTWKPL